MMITTSLDKRYDTFNDNDDEKYTERLSMTIELNIRYGKDNDNDHDDNNDVYLPPRPPRSTRAACSLTSCTWTWRRRWSSRQ